MSLCFERGLFDDDEDIRQLANQCISEIINCGNVATTHLTYIFPPLAKSLLSGEHYDDLVSAIIQRNTLDHSRLEHDLEEAQEGSLYSFERDNFYKNEVDFSIILSQFPINNNKLDIVKTKC